MATIQIVLEAINAASKTFNEVADQLDQVAEAEIHAAEAAQALSDEQLKAAQSAVDAIGAYAELRQTTADLARESEVAGVAVRELADRELAAANQAIGAAGAYARLSEETLAAGTAAIAAGEGYNAQTGALLRNTLAAAETYAALRALVEEDTLLATSAAVSHAAIDGLTVAEIRWSEAALAGVEAARAEAAAMDDLAAGAGRTAAELEAVIREWDDYDAHVAEAAAVTRAAGASMDGLAVRSLAVAGALRAASDSMRESTSAATAGARGWGFWGAAIRAANIKLPLFGGLLDGLAPKFMTQIALWHVAADAIIEVLAVWGPAIIASGAWGVAASDAINDVIRHMTNLHTVADATGQAIKPMTDNLEKMHDAVRPQVYQILGDALSVVTKRGGELNTVIMQTGQVFDQLAARTAMAINSADFSVFVSKSVEDVRLLGTAFGNLFGIIGNLIRMNQGWATVLLQVGTGFLGLVEKVTSLIIPLGQLAVLGHGFIVWVGLAVTLAVRFGAMLLGWGAAIVSTVADLISLGLAFTALAGQVGLADAALAVLGLVNPFVWVGLAVGAIAALAVVIGTAKDAVVTWGDSMQTALANAKTLDAGTKLLAADQAAVTSRLADANTKLAATQEYSATVNLHTGQAANTTSQAYAQQSHQVSELTGIQKTLAGQQQTYNTRLADLAKTYHGVANAQGLLITAGITMKQMLDSSGAAWAMIKQQVEGAYLGYGAMANQTGVLGNAMQVLDKQSTDQYNAMQKLNSGWDTQITAMTGVMTSFDTVAQGFNTLSSSSAKFTDSLGRLKVTGIDYVKSGIDGLSSSSIALNQAFSQQVGQINTMADSWRSAGLAQNIFKSGLAASIAPLEKYAAGSTEATAQLAGLAQEAGYQGPVSLDALNKYLGITSGQLKNTAGDMKTMQAAAQQATVQQALLTSAMQAQGNMIASQLVGDINSAILAYNGVAKAAAAYGQAVAQSGRQSDAAHNARSVLVTDLINAGRAAGDSTTQIAALITKITGIPRNVAIQIVMRGTGLFTVTGSAVSASQGAGGSGNAAGGLARGGMVYAKGAAVNKDSVPILAQLGEVVVPTKMVNAGAVDHLRGRLPGFAGGGLVLAGNTSVLSGDYAVNAYQQFKSAGITRMETAMMSAARSSGARFADGGVVGGNAPTGAAAGQAPYGGLFVQAAVVQGFSGGLEQLHTPLVLLVGAVRAQTTAIKASTTATAASTTATTAATTAAAKPKPAPKPPTQVQKDQKKIAADKANANTLSARIKAVEAAIKDTPKKDKSALASENKLLKTLETALSKQDKATGSDEKKLSADIIKTNKQVAAAMTKQIEAITKLLNSGKAGVDANALWKKLTADEHTLAVAQAAIAKQVSGASGGASKATATIDKGSLASLQAGEVKAFNAAVSKLKAELAHPGSTPVKQITDDLATLMRRQAAETAQYAKAAASQSHADLEHLLNLVHQELSTAGDKGLAKLPGTAAQMTRLQSSLDKLATAVTKAAGATTKAATSGSKTAGSSSYSSSGVVVDRKAETDLAAILAAARAEVSELKQVCTLLAAIKKEADPAAQAKAIGPAVAQALNAAGRASANAKTTRKG